MTDVSEAPSTVFTVRLEGQGEHVSGAPGWYDDPRNADVQWYWDGQSYTLSRPKSVAAASSGITPAILTSWPVIIVGFFLCFVPGLVLLWLRPGISVKVKSVVSGAVALFIAAAIALPPQPQPTGTTALPIAPAATPSSQPPSETRSTAPSPTLTPSPSPDSSSPVAGATSASPSTATGAAAAVVAALPVKGRAPKTGYSRDQFGSGWVDINRNGCDTRNDMLKLYLTNKVMSGSCKVLAGTLADPYTATSIRFVYGGASEVDIDHLVPLSDAWQKGAARWPFAKRVAFANDPINLQPTDASANRQKGDGDAATWLPPNRSYRCQYVARQAAVKKKYGVWVTSAEKAAMLAVLAKCPGQAIPAPGPQPTIASNTGGASPGSSPSPTKPSSGGRLDPRFATCKAAKAAGYGPYYRGKDPEYAWYTDRDSDGIVCE